MTTSISEPQTRRALAAAFCAGDELTARRIGNALAGAEMSATGVAVHDLAEWCMASVPDAAVVACDLSLFAASRPLRVLHRALQGTPLVVVSSAPGQQGVRKALSAGASAFVLESQLEEVLPIAVRAAAAGQTCIPRELDQVVERPAFSHRERQVLELIARGLTNAEIGARLYLAESTVKSHLSTSFRKLGVSSRREAAALVLDPESGITLARG